MTVALHPTPAAVSAPAAAAFSARLAVYGAPNDPPVVEEVHDGDAAALVEALCESVAERSALPAPAVREVIENLVHAGFRDAVVSVLDGGFTLRVSDHGPGIADPDRALRPGFSSAGPREREVVRGVGAGLPLAARLMESAGGGLSLSENLGGGVVATVSVPAPAAPVPETPCSEAARVILALLLEIGSGRPQQLAEELGRPLPECGRELAILQHRGLVAREPGGARRLTEAGAALVATLF